MPCPQYGAKRMTKIATKQVMAPRFPGGGKWDCNVQSSLCVGARGGDRAPLCPRVSGQDVTLRVARGDVGAVHEIAVIGSMTPRTSLTLVAGNPLRRACSRTATSSSAR